MAVQDPEPRLNKTAVISPMPVDEKTNPKRQRAVCTMDCPDACSLIVERTPKGEFRILGDPEHPFTRGFTCAKIKHHLDRLCHPDRVLEPRRKGHRGWKTISWDEALDLCAEKIQTLRQNPEAMLHIPGEGAKGVLKKGVGLFFAHLGASRIRGSLCDAAGYIAHVNDFGSRENPLPETLLEAGRIINWGKDLSRSSVHTAALIRKGRRKGTRVLTISPGGDGNRPFSDAMVRIRPGTDRFLAAAVIRRFIEAERVPEGVKRATRDWGAFEALILSWTVEDLMTRCGVDTQGLDVLFRWYTGDLPTATLVGAGVQRYRYGGENVRFINALAMVSGNMGRRGGGSYFHLHSFGNVNLDWTKPSEKRPGRRFVLPRIGQEILKAADPPVEMVWINGSNIVNQAANIALTARALASIPFKVVVDAFMTDTAERADLILPSTLMLEQTDLLGSYLHPHVQLAGAVLKPPGKARDDYWIVSELGKRLDPPVLMPPKEAAFDASLDTPFLKADLHTLRIEGSTTARRPDVPYEGLNFAHPDGRYHPPGSLSDEPLPPADYPLRLLSLIRRSSIHSQIPPEDQKMPPTIWASPSTLGHHLPKEARRAWLVSPLGKMAVRVREAADLVNGVVIYRRGDWHKLGGGINGLIEAGVTDLGNGAPFYDQYVRLEIRGER